jgi:hypothetical protein
VFPVTGFQEDEIAIYYRCDDFGEYSKFREAQPSKNPGRDRTEPGVDPA